MMKQEIDAICSLWKRDMIRFFRSKSRIIGSLGMPILFLVILGSGLNGALNSASIQGNYMEFITPGILSMVLLTGSLFSGILVLMDRQFGFLKETLIAPVSRTSIVIGKVLGGASTTIIQGLLMLIIAVILGVKMPLTAIPLAIVLMALVSSAFVALGIAIASLIDDMHGFQLIMNFLIMPLFFLSGALFPLSTAPDLLKMASYFDPLTYTVEALRFLLLGHSSIPFMTDISVLVVFFLVTTGFAVFLFEKIES